MKKIILFCFFISAVAISDAQIRKIPADVTDAFAARYPHAAKVEWRDKLQYFEANFQLNNTTITANFSSGGEWQGSERAMEFNDLTDAVKDGFNKSRYADWEQKSVNEVQEQSKPVKYKIGVAKSGIQKKNLFFDADGKLLKENITL